MDARISRSTRYWRELAPAARVGLFAGPLLYGLGLLGLQASLSLRTASAAATVLWMACWWILEPVPLWLTALLPLLLFPLFDSAPFFDLLLEYFDPVNFLFLGGMWIAAALEQWGVHRRMALGIVSFIGASPRGIVLGFMLGTAFISLWISNTAAAVLMFPIGMATLDKFGAAVGKQTQLRRSFGTALMLGIGYSASIGGVATKIGTGTNLVFVKQAAKLLHRDVSFVDWLKLGLPVVALVLPLAWLYITRWVTPLPGSTDARVSEVIESERRALGRMQRGEALALGAFVLAALLWVFRLDLDLGVVTIPGVSRVMPWTWSEIWGRPVSELPRPFSDLFGPRGGEAIIALGIAFLLMLLPARNFEPVLALRNASRISWGLLLLLGGGFAMAQGISASGLSGVLAGQLRSMGSLPPILGLFAVCLLTIALSEVASNTATASILLPVLAATGVHMGLEPAVVMFAATLSASFGLMLPAGTPPNAVVYASREIPALTMVRSGIVVDLGAAVLITLVCSTLGPLVLRAP